MSTSQAREEAARAAHWQPTGQRGLSGLRQALEAAVERAVAALDALDGDLDLKMECEDEGAQVDAELSMGWGAPNAWDDPLIPFVGRPGDRTSSFLEDAEL